MTHQPFIVIGCGGFGKEVLWTAQNFNAVQPTYDILGYCDDDPTKQGQEIYGYPVLGSPEAVNAELGVKPCFICSIGNNAVRARVVRRVLDLGWLPVTIIDPSVIVAADVTVGVGTYVGANTMLCPNARIGNHVIINNYCTIGHDSELGDFAQISPGSRVSGASVVEAGALLGSNAVVAQLRRVGRNAILGACSFAVNDIPPETTAVGVPARVTFRRSSEGETQ